MLYMYKIRDYLNIYIVGSALKHKIKEKVQRKFIKMHIIMTFIFILLLANNSEIKL